MILELEKSKVIINTDTLKRLGEGKDGTIFEFNNQALKTITSGYMTEEKIIDLREAIPNSDEIRIVPPIEIAKDKLTTRRKVKLNIADGYTSRIIKENPSFILMKETNNFLEEVAIIRKQVRDYLSVNQIALSDSNPNNVLVSLDNDKIYIIDHDRDITPSCMHFEKASVKNGNYYEHNDRKLALLMYKSLLRQILNFNGINFRAGGDPVISFVENETGRDDITFKTIENALTEYKNISDYTKDITRKIKRR